MTTKFTDKLKGKTDSELMEYVQNRGSYQNEAILTAIMELETRGHSNDEMQTLKNKIQSTLQLEKKFRTKLRKVKFQRIYQTRFQKLLK